MARRRREAEEKPDDWGFQVEPFNEEEVVRKEWRGFRSTIVLFAWSVVAALVSFLVWNPVEGHDWAWELGLAIGIALGFGLRWLLPLAKVSIAEFHKKEWFGTGAMYFFSWLAFFLLFTNPPLHDGSGPAIDIVATPEVQEPGGEVFVVVRVSDNDAVDHGSVAVRVFAAAGDPVGGEALRTPEGRYLWSHEFVEGEDGDYTVRVEARDVEGNRALREAPFRVRANAVNVTFPARNAFDEDTDALRVAVPPCADDGPCLDVWRVVLDVEGGGEVPFKYDKARKQWLTSPQFLGTTAWGGAGEKTVTIRVEEHASYLRDVPAAAIVKGPYNVTVEESFPVGGETVKEPRKRPEHAQTPGFEALFLAAALVVAVALRRRAAGAR